MMTLQELWDLYEDMSDEQIETVRDYLGMKDFIYRALKKGRTVDPDDMSAFFRCQDRMKKAIPAEIADRIIGNETLIAQYSARVHG